MANRPARTSALAALRAGATIEGDSGKSASETKPEVAKEKGMEGGGIGNPGTGSASVSPGATAPTAAFGNLKRADDYQNLSTEKPKEGRHPKTGETVEIDWSAPGASVDTPFGLLPDGSPRVRRAGKRGAKNATKVGQASVAKSSENVTVLADAIRFAHIFAAQVTQHTHWIMDEKEAEAYADAITDLQSAYGVDLNPQQAALAKCAVVIGVPTVMRCVASMRYKPKPKIVPPVQQANKNPVEKPKAQKTQEPTTARELYEQNGGLFEDGFSPEA